MKSKSKRKGSKRPVGHPTLYDPKITPKVTVMYAREGLTDVEICKKLGIHVATLYRWKLKYPEFSEALKDAKDIADAQIEDKLFNRANGFEYTKTSVETDGDGNIIKRKAEQVHVLPDTTAQIFWLKNRQPRKWRDVQRRMVDMTLDASVHPAQDEPPELDESNLTTEELEMFNKLLEKMSSS